MVAFLPQYRAGNLAALGGRAEFAPPQLAGRFLSIESLAQGTPPALEELNAHPMALTGSPTRGADYVEFTSNGQYGTTSGVSLPIPSGVGQGEVDVGPVWTLLYEIWSSAWGGPGVYRNIVGTNSNSAFYTKGDKCAAYGLFGAERVSTVALPTSQWVKCRWTMGPNLRLRYYQDGALATDFGVVTQSGTVPLNEWGGFSAANYPLTGRIRKCYGLLRELTLAEIIAFDAGTYTGPLPFFRYLFDEGSGATVLDRTQVLGAGSALATIVNSVGTDLTASGAERAEYREPATVIHNQPKCMTPSALRFNGSANQAAATGLAAAGVTDLSCLAGVRVSRSFVLYEPTLKDKPLSIVGFAKSGTTLGGTGAGDEWIALCYRAPNHLTTTVACEWEVRWKEAGGSVQSLKGGLVLGVPWRIGFRYHGEATAGNRYVEVWSNGAIATNADGAQARITGSTVPANLDVDGTTALCPATGTDLYRAGIDLDYLEAGAALWPDAQMAAFDAWIAARGNYPTITAQRVFGSGNFGGTSPEESFTLGGAAAWGEVADKVIIAATVGNGDPADNFKVVGRSSPNRGVGYGLPYTIFDKNGAASPGCYGIGNCLLQLVSGTMLGVFSTADAATNINWTADYKTSVSGGAWSADAPIVPTGLPANFTQTGFLGYWSPGGQPTQLPDGTIRVPCYGWYSTSAVNQNLGNYRCFWIEFNSTLSTCTYLMDLNTVSGYLGSTGLVEPAIAWVGGSGASRIWIWIARVNLGASNVVSISLDDGNTWSLPLSVGSGATYAGGGTITQPFVWGGENSSDPNERVYALQAPRSSFEDGVPTFSVNRNPGLCVAWSKTAAAGDASFAGIVQLTFGHHGWHYGCALDLGDGTFLIVTTQDDLKCWAIIVPYSFFATLDP